MEDEIIMGMDSKISLPIISENDIMVGVDLLVQTTTTETPMML